MNLSENIFMAGVGGAGMAPLAIYLAQSGYCVTGYDDAFRAPVRALLESQGVKIVDKPVLPPDTDRLVYSNALESDAPILVQAKAHNIPILKRGAMLALITANKKLIAIVGSHGKTTTAGMLIRAMQANVMRFDYILGGYFMDYDVVLPAQKQNDSQWFVTEVDESDGTIDLFCPEVTVAVNFDWDHADFYPKRQDLEDTFEHLFQRTKNVLFIPNNCDTFSRLSQSAQVAVKTFGAKGDYAGEVTQITDNHLQLRLQKPFTIDTIEVPARGAFNAHNAIAALAVVQHHKASLLPDSLSDFTGIHRRQQLLYKDSTTVVYQDYAHHPSEIHSLLTFAYNAYPRHLKIVIFQPHRYSRTFHYKEAFVEALGLADKIFLMDVYPASEPLLKGGERSDLIACFETTINIASVDTLPQLTAQLERDLQSKNLILFIGAGDIDLWAESYVKKKFIEKKRTPPVQPFHSNDWWETVRSKIKAETYLASAENLADKTTLHIGGNARYYAEPASLKDLRLLLEAAKKEHKPVFILGRGSNLIVPDEGFNGLVIRLNNRYWRTLEQQSGCRLWASSGTPLKQICSFAKQHGLTGFEFLEGIPGSLGGALRMNAGAMGIWIFNRVESVRVLNLDGTIKNMKQEELHIAYRECNDLKKAVALGAVLKATEKADPQTVKITLEQFADYRRSSQPRQLSAGCIFKNPPQHSAGALIERSGLKGRRCGAARVSPVHGNFIINEGGATYKEIITLIQEVRSEVKTQMGIELEPEVMLLGKKWEDVL